MNERPIVPIVIGRAIGPFGIGLSFLQIWSAKVRIYLI